MSTPEPGPAPTVPEPLPESVKAAHRRKLALATAKQAGAQTQPDRGTPEPASTVPETCPEPACLVELEAITEGEARMLVSRIRDHISDARALVLELYEREGWRALGYKNWTECTETEFPMSSRQVFRLLSAAQVERNISTDDLSVKEPIPGDVLRPLAGLEPEQQREAWKAATEATPTPTAAQVERVAYSLRPVKKKPPGRSKTEKLLMKLPIDGEYERQMREKFAFFWDQLISNPRFSAWRHQKCASIITDYLDSYLTYVSRERAVEAVHVESDQSPVAHEYCEVGWILLTTERDLAVLALTPENEKWEESGLKFFESLRKRKIVTVL
jgi:hypothetical protein